MSPLFLIPYIHQAQPPYKNSNSPTSHRRKLQQQTSKPLEVNRTSRITIHTKILINTGITHRRIILCIPPEQPYPLLSRVDSPRDLNREIVRVALSTVRFKKCCIRRCIQITIYTDLNRISINSITFSLSHSKHCPRQSPPPVGDGARTSWPSPSQVFPLLLCRSAHPGRQPKARTYCPL